MVGVLGIEGTHRQRAHPCCNPMDTGTRHTRACPPSWSAGGPAPASATRDVSHSETAGSSSPRGKWAAIHRRQNPQDVHTKYVSGEEVFGTLPFGEIRRKSILLGISHTDPQARVHLRSSDYRDGSAAATPRDAQVPTLRSTETMVLRRAQARVIDTSRCKALGASR